MTLTVTPTVDMTSTPPSVSLSVVDSTNSVTSVTVQRYAGGGASDTVRTSDGGSLPLTSSPVTVRTNLVAMPQPTPTYGVGAWSGYTPSGGVVATSTVATGGPTGAAGFLRRTTTTAVAGVGGPFYPCANGSATTAGNYTASAWVRSSVAGSVTPAIEWHDSGGALISATTSPLVSLAANTWTRVSISGTAPAGNDHITFTVFGSGPLQTTSATFDVTMALVEASGALGTYFDGNTTDTAADTYAWTGTTGSSTSTDTPAASKVATLVDYLPPYGVPVSYSVNGGTPSNVIVVDVLEPWLIHPFTPSLSRPVELRQGSLDTRTRATSRGVFKPVGRKRPLVVTGGARQDPESALIVSTTSEAEIAQLEQLLADDQVLLFNVSPQLGLAVTTNYLSIGDVDEVRPSGAAGTDSTRDWKLPFLVVDPPISGTAANTSGGSPAARTWADMAVQYGTWAAAEAVYSTWAKAEAGTPG